MPIAYGMVRTGTLMHVIGSGRCAYEDVLELRHRILSDPRIPDVFDILLDLTPVSELCISPAEITELAELVAAEPRRTCRRVAIVSNTEQGWQAGKQWEQEADRLGRTCIVFGDLDSACLWLGIDEDVREQIGGQEPSS